MILKYINHNYANIKQVLNSEFKISARLQAKLIKSQKITLNGIICDTRTIIAENDVLEINLDFEEDNSNIVPTFMPLNIIYEDDAMLVVSKPANMPVHPSLLHYTDTLSNAVKFYFDKINLRRKIRPVNRLDSNTSGLVVFAKNEYIQECLIQQMEKNIFKKKYIAIVDGILPEKSGIINAPIARKEDSIIERCVSAVGQPSITHFRVLSESQNYSVVECILETGRTHQIRVHFSYIGHPILGDSLYGTSSSIIDRQALHCYNLQCVHPISKLPLNFCADLPEDMKYFYK